MRVVGVPQHAKRQPEHVVLHRPYDTLGGVGIAPLSAADQQSERVVIHRSVQTGAPETV